MAYDAKLGTQTFRESTVIDHTHPPVVWDFPVATGQGELAPGTVVAFNAAGAVVPYDPNGAAPVNDPIGILTMRVDTDKEDVAPVLIHGCGVRKYVSVGGNPVDDETVAKLRAKQIFVR